MRLKTTFILLTLLILSVFGTGIGLLYYDTQKSTELDWVKSKKRLEKNLILLSYLSHFRELTQLPFENYHSLENAINNVRKSEKLIEINFGKETLPFISEGELVADIKKANLGYLNSIKRIQTLEKRIEIIWKRVERVLSDSVKEGLSRKESFLPNVKKTLEKWSQDLPLFEKVKNSLAITLMCFLPDIC